ncbi:MAG TPA: hypothetical protein VNW46_01130 [Gemmatimonadaceae bacterium]|nr:hypothetical protein [Gemmatimonadaceae bacterium]
MTARRALTLALAVILASAHPAAAQQASGDTNRQPRRQLLEQVKQRWMAVVRDRLQLTDAQMARLEETNRHFSAQRSQLNQAERGIRGEMRGQLSGTATADDKRLAVLIDSLLDIQRQRLEIVRGEQRELALFITPLQRVRYLALQEQLRQRVEALRQRARAGGTLPDSDPGGF